MGELEELQKVVINVTNVVLCSILPIFMYSTYAILNSYENFGSITTALEKLFASDIIFVNCLLVTIFCGGIIMNLVSLKKLSLGVELFFLEYKNQRLEKPSSLNLLSLVLVTVVCFFILFRIKEDHHYTFSSFWFSYIYYFVFVIVSVFSIYAIEYYQKFITLPKTENKK